MCHRTAHQSRYQKAARCGVFPSWASRPALAGPTCLEAGPAILSYGMLDPVIEERDPLENRTGRCFSCMATTAPVLAGQRPLNFRLFNPAPRRFGWQCLMTALSTSLRRKKSNNDVEAISVAVAAIRTPAQVQGACDYFDATCSPNFSNTAFLGRWFTTVYMVDASRATEAGKAGNSGRPLCR